MSFTTVRELYHYFAYFGKGGGFGPPLTSTAIFRIITTTMKKIIITVVGKDTVGILAGVCTYLAKARINILEISQTVVGGYFNMMMIADGAKCRKAFEDVAADLGELGIGMGLKIHCQKSEIFEKMHRV